MCKSYTRWRKNALCPSIKALRRAGGLRRSPLGARSLATHGSAHLITRMFGWVASSVCVNT
jgi:hypothetical protein